MIPGVAALMLTKVDSPEHVLAVRRDRRRTGSRTRPAAGQDEVRRSGGNRRRLLPHRADRQIASAHRRPQPGIRGFRRRCRHAVRTRGPVLSQAAHACSPPAPPGIMPMGFIGSIADFRDQEAFRAIVRRSRRLGFVGASAIHPLQVPVLNEEFSPDPAEVERAERMIAAYDAAYAAGPGRGAVRGRDDRRSGGGAGAHRREAGGGVAGEGAALILCSRLGPHLAPTWLGWHKSGATMAQGSIYFHTDSLERHDRRRNCRRSESRDQTNTWSRMAERKRCHPALVRRPDGVGIELLRILPHEPANDLPTVKLTTPTSGACDWPPPAWGRVTAICQSNIAWDLGQVPINRT